MPALMTHDFFGKDVLAANPDIIGASLNEKHAFLLGNQGPDPLFYVVATRSARAFSKFGSAMHHDNTTGLMLALKESLCVLDEEELPIGRAYAAGFLCHYALDRAMHPLVYSQQFALCDAGIEGLSRADENEVHGEIEREFDEMVLHAKTAQTIMTYKPYEQILHASDVVLDVIGKMYAFIGMRAFRVFPPITLYKSAIKAWRRVQKMFYVPNAASLDAVARAETSLLRRNHSFFKSMAHRVSAKSTSDFENGERAAWQNPFTHTWSTASFWDIFASAQREAPQLIGAFFAEDFGEEAAARLTRGLDFSGEPAA